MLPKKCENGETKSIEPFEYLPDFLELLYCHHYKHVTFMQQFKVALLL